LREDGSDDDADDDNDVQGKGEQGISWEMIGVMKMVT
jgi:hypothetical protein